MEKQISIILPAYKAIYLEQAISTILAQSYPYFELVVVDDASPEDLESIVRGFDDSRLSYHRNPQNLGRRSLVTSWNHAISYAKYDYLVLASDDDLYDRDFLAEMVALSDQYPDVELFRSRVAVIDGRGAVMHSTAPVPEWESVLDFIRGRISGHREMFVPEFMCRRSALMEVGGFVDFPCAWGSDSATWYSVAQRGGVVCSERVLFSFRMSGVNISSGGHIESKLAALGMYDRWLHRFVETVAPNDCSADDIRQRISPHFTENKFRILLYTPVSQLLRLLPRVAWCDKVLIVRAVAGKLTAKFK